MKQFKRAFFTVLHIHVRFLYSRNVPETYVVSSHEQNRVAKVRTLDNVVNSGVI